MTDEQIEKALECCCSLDMTMCEKCPYFEWIGRGCVSMSTNDALALIRGQKAKIEKLIDECGSQSVLWRNYFASNYEIAKESIKAEARARAIREFAERVRSETCDAHPLVLEFVREVVNSIEQEMTEEQK